MKYLLVFLVILVMSVSQVTFAKEDRGSPYPTVVQVQQMIDDSLASLSLSISSLVTELSALTQRIISLESLVTGHTSEITALKTQAPKTFKVYDSNNMYLGTVVNLAQTENSVEGHLAATVFNEQYSKMIDITSVGLVPFVPPEYTNTSCSGTAYFAGNFVPKLEALFSTIYLLGGNSYGYADMKAGKKTITSLAYRDQYGVCIPHTFATPVSAYEVIVMGYPYSSTISAPLEVRYE